MDVLCTDKTGTLTQDKIILSTTSTRTVRKTVRAGAGLAQQPPSKRHQKPDGSGGHLLL
jgi:magnesium-transporting ATPase (P-type)